MNEPMNAPVRISVGPPADTPANQQLNFSFRDISDEFWMILIQITAKNSYSAIEFLNGIRKSSNFKRAWSLILDFDDGMSIEEAKKVFGPYFGYIATTKSHRKSEKNGKPIESRDRFRVILFLKKPIEDSEVFKIVMTNLITEFGADQACKDLARFYFPNPTQESWFLTEGVRYFDIEPYIQKKEKTLIKGKSQAVSKPVDGSGEYTPLDGSTIITDDSGTSATAVEWYGEMQVDDKINVHCPAPEHKDSNPSAFITKTEKKSLFYLCSSCGRKGFYNEIGGHHEKNVVTISSTTSKKRGNIQINQFSNRLIQQLEFRGEYDTEDIVTQMLNTDILITFYVGSLYFYIDNYWRKHKDKDTEKKVFVKSSIQNVTGKRPLNGQIDTIHKELCNEFIDSPESDEILINFENCVLKINDGCVETKEHNPIYGFKYKLEFDYNPNAKCPKTDAFLLEVIEEQAAIDMLWEFIGSSFISNNFFKLEKSVTCVGSGSNGKSVVLDLFRHLLGESNISTVSLKDMNDPNRRHAMVGKLINIAAEGSSKKFDSEDFKSIVSREPLPVRQLYSDPIETSDFPRTIFATNSLPYSGGDTSHGILRRINIIPFENIIPEEKQDKQLLQKLLPELSGIMNKVIEGMTRLLKNQQLTHSPKVDKAGKAYEIQINPVKYFVAEQHLEFGDENTPIYDVKELYEQFSKFCNEVGIQRLAQRNFTPLMNNIFGKQVHSNKLYGWRIEKPIDIECRKPDKSPYSK